MPVRDCSRVLGHCQDTVVPLSVARPYGDDSRLLIVYVIAFEFMQCHRYSGVHFITFFCHVFIVKG